jgi:hypothetical protein
LWQLARRPYCRVRRVVIGESYSDCIRRGYRDDYWDVAIFRVVKVWKGRVEAEVRVRTFPGGGNACGFEWHTGEDWVIYSDARDDDAFYSHICTRSRPGAAAAREAADLDLAEAGS